MRKNLFTATVLLLFSFLSSAQEGDSLMIRHIADEILLNGKAYTNLQYLTKQIGGRLAGSPQMVKAESWGLKTMTQSGADKSYLQECMVPHWVRGGTDMASYTVTGKTITGKLDVVALGNSVGTGSKGLSADVILINSFQELDEKKDQLKGKIVFYNYKFNSTLIPTFRAYGDAVRYRTQGPSKAAKYGAAGIIIRSMSHSTDNNPHTGVTIYDSNYAKIPAVAAGLKDADKLAELLQTSKVTVRMVTNGRFLPDTIGHNVIGELTGTDMPGEIILIGGHLDSWDNCEGAHDDGAGVVQTMEVLRALKAVGYKPRHTIRFVLFANEENGGRGGDKYAEEAAARHEKHIFAIESDAGGFTPRGFGLTMNEEQFQKIMEWKSLIAPYGCSEFNRGGGGSDIGPLNRSMGTPMGSLNPDSQRYFDIHHSRGDVFEAVNKRELELGAVNMAALIYLIDKYGL